MAEKQFVIGIGSQRAGSTLLYKALDECTDVYMNPVKELHYFDTLHRVRNEKVLRDFSRRQIDREIDRIVSSKNLGFVNKRYKNYLHANRLLENLKFNDFRYLDLFRPCVMDNAMLGEVTPEYMILPEEGVMHLRDTVGEDAKIVLLTRNPVDRFVSSFKLLNNYRGGSVNDVSREIVEVLDAMPMWTEQQKSLSQYRVAYELYKKYFNTVIVRDYLDFVKEDGSGIHQILTDLDLPYDSEKIDGLVKSRVNSLGEPFVISEHASSIIENYFGDEVSDYKIFKQSFKVFQ